jgi:hypothetical protein
MLSRANQNTYAEQPVSCRRGSSCMYDDTFSWFGCCTGTRLADCNVATACVQSRNWDECLEDEECYGDLFAIAWYVNSFFIDLLPTNELCLDSMSWLFRLCNSGSSLELSFFTLVVLRLLAFFFSEDFDSPSQDLFFISRACPFFQRYSYYLVGNMHMQF